MSNFKDIEETVVGAYKKIEETVVDGYKKIEDGVVGGYKKIEDGVVEGFEKITDKFESQSRPEALDNIENTVTEGYKKIENSVVGAFQKISDSFVDKFLANEGESAEEAKQRLLREQAERDSALKADMAERAAKQQAMVDASLEAARNAGKIN